MNLLYPPRMFQKKMFVASLLFFLLLVWLLVQIWGASKGEFRYRLVDLGVPSSSAHAINNEGTVLGYARTKDDVPHFAWSEAAGIVLAGTGVNLRAINDRGYAVGYIQNSSTEPVIPVIWNSERGLDAIRELGIRQYQSGMVFSDINNRNQISGTISPPYLSTDVPLVEQSAGFVLDATNGLRILDLTESAGVIDDLGNVFGLNSNETSFEAFIVKKDGDRINLTGGDYLENPLLFMNGRNSHGHFAGWIDNVTRESQAIIWREDNLIYLDGLGGHSTEANDLSDQGIVVGESQTWFDDFFLQLCWSRSELIANLGRKLQKMKPRPYPHTAVIWIDGRIQDLNDITKMAPDWYLESARAINNRGQIVGDGFYGEEERPFLLNPIE